MHGDSDMPLGEVGEHLPRLEAHHDVTNTESSGLRCPCAAQVAADVQVQIEELGSFHNDLEERTYQVEVSDQSRGELINNLQERVRLCEESRANANDGRQSVLVHETSELHTNGTDLEPLEEQLVVHQRALDRLGRRLAELEEKRRTPSSASSLSTIELAQALIQRLNSGDMIRPETVLELEAALRPSTAGSLGRLGVRPYTPSLTDIRAGQSTSDLDARPSHKRKPGRPPRTSLNNKNADEPLSKKPRGRPPGLSADSTSSDEPPLRRRPGRPPKSGQVPHKSDLLSTQSSLEPSQSDTMAGDDPETITAQANLDHSTAHSPTWEGNVANTIVCRKVVVTDTGSASEEVTRVPTPEVHNTVVQPEENTGVDLDEQAEGLAGPVTEVTSERRSGRTPKPAKKFGDVVTWKEADLQLQGHTSLMPYKARTGKLL